MAISNNNEASTETVDYGTMSSDDRINALAAALSETDADETVSERSAQDSEEEVLETAETDEEESDDAETDEAEDETEAEGDEDEAEEDNSDVEDEIDPERIVKWKAKNGDQYEDMEVTFKELQHGYMRHRDYTFKQQELAEARKNAEKEIAKRAEDLSVVMQIADPVMAQIQQSGLTMEQYVTQLRAKNPQLAQQTIDHLQRRANALQWLESQKAEQEKQETAARIERERNLLSSALPEWNDQEVMQKEAKQIVDYLREYGLTDEEIMEINNGDHRLILMLREAALKKGTEKSIKAKEQKPKVKQIKSKATKKSNQFKQRISSASKKGDISALEKDLAELLS